MPNYTTNYQLEQPFQDEFYDVAVQNGNMSIIDRVLGEKVDKVTGKGLSTNDYTNDDKAKINKLPTNVDEELEAKAKASDLTAHTENTGVHVTTSEKNTWNGKIAKINPRTAGNIPQIKSDGTLEDSGKSFSDLPTTSNVVPPTRKINNKALSVDITLNASDVNAVPTTRKVNNKALSADITLNAQDVGARSSSWVPTPSQVGAEPAVVTEGTRSGNITLTLQNNHVYPCTGVTALNITVPANVAAHLFVATSSAVTITFTAGSGVTLRAPDGEIEPLEANANYEISIWNGNIIIVQVGAVA